MTKDQENKLSMYYRVQTVCNENDSVWNGLPAFVTAFGLYETGIGDIETVAKVQGLQTKGIARDKDADEDEMIRLTLEVAGAVFSYASSIDDETLKESVNFTESGLKQERDSDTLSACRTVYDIAADIGVTILGPFGVDTAKLAELNDAIDAFNTINPLPLTARTRKKGATSDLVTLFSENDKVLTEQMDKLMEKFKVSNPTFYKLYFDARAIFDLGTRTTFVSGLVLDAATATPIVEASVKLVLDPGEPEEEIRETLSGEEGDYRFESMKAGDAKLRVQKSGYKDVELNIVVESGKENVVGVKMERI